VNITTKKRAREKIRLVSNRLNQVLLKEDVLLMALVLPWFPLQILPI